MKILVIFALLYVNLFAYDILEEPAVYLEDMPPSWSVQVPQFDPYFDKDYTPLNNPLNDKIGIKERKLLEDTAYLQLFMIGTIGVLYAMPTSVTNWEDEDISLVAKWKEHVKNGPVWDEDDFAINYIGHPVSGAWYYMIAREDGFDPWESFLYSFTLSSFFWEYGYEAFAEIPSIQDLIFTPFLGSIMGEGFWYLQVQLDRHKGVLFGSKIAGNIAYFLLNPIKRITSTLHDHFQIDMQFRYMVYQPTLMTQVSPMLQNIDYVPSSYGFVVDIQF